MMDATDAGMIGARDRALKIEPPANLQWKTRQSTYDTRRSQRSKFNNNTDSAARGTSKNASSLRPYLAT
jgi:hypothetical protein